MVFSFSTLLTALQKPGARAYTPIPTPGEEILMNSPDGKLEETIITSSNKSFFLDPSFWLTAFAALSVALTIRNLLAIQLQSQELYVSYLEAPIARPYNGLEKIPRNESSPSWPLSSIHYPGFLGATEGAYVHHALNDGSVVRLDSERTIIIQHRVRDYGLERCAVKVEFLPPHSYAPRAYGHIMESPYLTLWRLDGSGSKVVLTSSALPTPLPTGKEFIGNISLDATHATESPFFECSSGSIQTLEIVMACTSDPCIMEFRLTQSPHRQGFWVIQSE